MKKIFSFLLAGFVFSAAAFAQFNNLSDYVTKIWTSADGLPGNSIADIVQSKNGYMYFGTYECLVRFDGNEFVCTNKYSNSNYSFISARSVFEDSTGVMWIGSNDEGVQKIDGKQTVSYSIQNGLPNNSIRDFCEDRYHNIWVGTAAGVVYITPDGTVKTPAASSSINLNHVLVNQFFCDTADRIWMITNDVKGLYLYTGGSFERYTGLDDYGNFIASAITQDKNGDIWISLSQQGIVKISSSKITKIVSGTNIDKDPTNCIYCDDSGSLWFGTEKGLVLYKDGIFASYDENNAISNGSINKILGDREGNIWIATGTGGIAKISPGKFRMNRIDIPVNAICEDNEGLVWVGTDEGLLCYRNEIPVQNELTEFCKGVRIRHIGISHWGEILVNCYSKPAQVLYDGAKIMSWTSDEGLAGNKTRVSLISRHGEIYCGTTTGLSVISGDGNIRNYTINSGFDCEYIMWLYEDTEGLIWVGTDGGGIYVMQDGNVIRKISTEDGFAGNVIFKIFQDKTGAFWICTGSGTTRFVKDKENFVTQNIKESVYNFTSGNGLGSDSVFQILFDEANIVWMVSNRGISSVAYEDMQELVDGKKELIDCKFYNENDGLKSSGANSTALSMKDKFGRMWFTMADGFAVYDPLKAKTPNVLPLVHIEGVKLDEKEIEDFSVPVIIPAGTKHIDIKYTGLSYSSGERNRFTHMMRGFDNEYSELSAERTVSYTNLRPGKYTFVVNVQNGEGNYSSDPGVVHFIQKTFIYQRMEFWIAVGVLVAFIIFMSFFSMNKMNKKRQLLLETKIQMATVELQMAKDDSERLLKNILPVSIAERMKGLGGEKTIADTFDNVTVLFSDIVGFTNKTSSATAEEIVSSLNNLISRFDKRAASMGIEKIKTIGDAYMAACGVPVANEKHALLMVRFAMGMYKDLTEYNKTAKIKFNIRIGLNSGPVIAGVIGKNKFIYDIWGDTVNVASRMEGLCKPGHIRMTEAVKNNLEEYHICFKYREEECDVKGKGLMKTFEIPE